jgi:hypothetical protein
MPTFMPEKQHHTAADGTVFQGACYSSDYDWSQHVSEEVKSEIGDVPAEYDWTQHVSLELREEVRQKCCAQAGADALAYAKSLGDAIAEDGDAFIAGQELHDGVAHKYDDAPTDIAKRARKLFQEAEKAKPATYAEKLAVQSVLAENPKLKTKDALAAARAKMGE